MPWRTRTIVQLHGALRASRPQLERGPLGSMAILRFAFAIIAALASTAILTAILGPWVAWFLPLVMALVLVRYWRRLPFRIALLVLAIAGTLNGLWASLLLSEGHRLPVAIQTLLTLHIDPAAELARSRYAPVGASGPEFLGIVYVITSISAAGLVLMLLAGMIRKGPGGPKAQRLAFKVAVAVLFVGGGLLIWFFAPAWRIVIVIPMYFAALAGLAGDPGEFWPDDEGHAA